MGLVRSALVTEEKCISQLLFWLISYTYSPSRQELASPGLLSHRFGQLGIAGQPAFRRDTFIFEMRPVFIRKSGTRETSSGWTAEVYFTLPRDKLRDVLTCITNHPYTNYEIETPPKKIVPLAEALLSSLLYIFPASYRLPWCTPSPMCGPHFLLQDYLHQLDSELRDLVWVY